VMVRLAWGTQTKAKRKFRKWMGAMTGKTAVIVNFQIDERNEFSDDAVLAFFASLSFGVPLSVSETLDRLSFTLDVVAPFRVTGNVGVLAVLLVTGPDPVGRGGKYPSILALRDIGTPPDADIEKYAAAALRSTQGYRKAEIRSTKKIIFAGRDGIEFEGVSDERGVPIVFKQRFAVIDGTAALRVVASGSEAEMKRLGPEIERIFSSISLK